MGFGVKLAMRKSEIKSNRNLPSMLNFSCTLFAKDLQITQPSSVTNFLDSIQWTNQNLMINLFVLFLNTTFLISLFYSSLKYYLQCSSHFNHLPSQHQID